MRIAIIDLGTNSVRFDVHQLGPGNKVRELHREKLMVRLGQSLFSDGKLDRNAIRRTLDAFVSFQKTASALHVDKYVAFGTSALREARDGSRLLRQIHSRTGIDVRVIPGDEEARLIAQGILANEKRLAGKFALIDIGGGSTEISICKGKEILFAASFPLGTARMQQIFLQSSPPRKPIDELRRYIRNVLYTKFLAEEWPKVSTAYGSSGTVRALTRLSKKAAKKGPKKSGKKKNLAKTIELKELRKLVRTMSTMNTTELLSLRGMEARRVDMILAGAIMLEECMNCLGAKKTALTEFSLREGILDQEIRLFRADGATRLTFSLDQLEQKLAQFSSLESRAHAKQVAALSAQLFDATKRLHRLDDHWRTYLVAAATLHDIGEAISPADHEEHSAYIVKNAEFPAMEKWEANLIASLCLWHRDGKPSPKQLSLGGDKSRRQAFTRLLALLRLADALDRGHKGQLRLKAVRVGAHEVRLQVASKTSVDLELLRVEQKKPLFEQVFKRRLRVERA